MTPVRRNQFRRMPGYGIVKVCEFASQGVVEIEIKRSQQTGVAQVSVVERWPVIREAAE